MDSVRPTEPQDYNTITTGYSYKPKHIYKLAPDVVAAALNKMMNGILLPETQVREHLQMFAGSALNGSMIYKGFCNSTDLSGTVAGAGCL